MPTLRRQIVRVVAFGMGGLMVTPLKATAAPGRPGWPKAGYSPDPVLFCILRLATSSKLGFLEPEPSAAGGSPMALTPGEPCVQTCPNCGTLVDISEQEPLSKFQCPQCGENMRASRQYNHFSVVEHLGTGGMGAVYKALDRNLNRMVALKLLRKELSADDNYIVKLEDEARITASINHPFVVKVFSFGQDHGQYYIAMELVDKGTLDDLMQLQNRISEMQVLQVGLQIASGLQAAHERGLIHRDVKPGNILFADAHTAKITDFGLALLAEHEADARGEIWGTPYYIAPEKLNNEPEDFRSDIYSLGGTLFHAVAGRPPFEAESASLVALKHLKSKAVSLQAFAPDVASETAYVINRMLNKDPNARYASYGELIDHFRYAIDQLGAKAGKPHSGRQRVVVESKQQGRLAGILTLLLLVVLIAGGIGAYVFRAKLFDVGGSEPGVVTAPTVAANSAGPADTPAVDKDSAEGQYQQGRGQLVAGQYADAQGTLLKASQRDNVPQPLRNWIKLHRGMAALLNHQFKDARALFGSLRDAGLYSGESNQRALANFFVETGRFLETDKSIPASVTKDWNKDTFEAMALLLFGLKDWELGAFDDADALLKVYLDGKRPDAYRWLDDYEPIARRATHDYALYAPLHERMQAGAGDRAALAAEFVRVRGQLQTTGKMPAAFDAAVTELNASQPPTGVAAAPPPTIANGNTPPATGGSAAPSAEEQKADTARWLAARDGYLQLVAQSRFEEAQKVIDGARPTQTQWVQARDQTDRRARLLVAFHKTMLNDLKVAGGYPQPVASRRGVTYPRGINGVQGDTLLAGTPYGQIAVPWTDFAPTVYLAVAAYYADATRDLKQAAARRWMMAAYALDNGRAADAKALAVRAAKDAPQYQGELGQFDPPAR